MPSRRGSGDVLARAGDTGLARWLAAAQPWEHGLAQTERGASLSRDGDGAGRGRTSPPMFAVRNCVTLHALWVLGPFW